MSESVESRAVKIAAGIMVRNGICRHESATECRRLFTDDNACGKCLEKWLLGRARRELTGYATPLKSGYDMTDDELMKFRFQRRNIKKHTGYLAEVLRMDRKDFEAAVKRGMDKEASRFEGGNAFVAPATDERSE